MSKPLPGSFESFCSCPHSRITATTWMRPMGEQVNLLDPHFNFKQALRDFALQVDAYRAGPRRPKPEPKAQNSGTMVLTKLSEALQGREPSRRRSYVTDRDDDPRGDRQREEIRNEAFALAQKRFGGGWRERLRSGSVSEGEAKSFVRELLSIPNLCSFFRPNDYGLARARVLGGGPNSAGYLVFEPNFD